MGYSFHPPQVFSTLMRPTTDPPASLGSSTVPLPAARHTPTSSLTPSRNPSLERPSLASLRARFPGLSPAPRLPPRPTADTSAHFPIKSASPMPAADVAAAAVPLPARTSPSPTPSPSLQTPAPRLAAAGGGFDLRMATPAQMRQRQRQLPPPVLIYSRPSYPLQTSIGGRDSARL